MAKKPPAKRLCDTVKGKMAEPSSWNGVSVIAAMGTLAAALNVNELAVLSDPVIAGAVVTVVSAIVGIIKSERR